MTDDKKKNKNYQTEWSFDFQNIGKQVGEFFGSLGESIGGDEEIEVDTYVSALDGATFAQVKVAPSVGKHTLTALDAGSENLLEAEVAHVGEVTFTIEGEAERSLELGQKNAGGIAANIRRGARVASAGGDKLYWHMGLSPDVPMQLEINSGVGEGDYDLSGLQINGLTMNTGVGKVTTILPALESPYAVKAKSGVGETNFVMPANTTVSLNVSAGVGQVNIDVPADAAVRLQVKARGIGSTNVPAQLKPVSGSSEGMGYSGVYETEGFAVADRQITIEYAGGLGTASIRFVNQGEEVTQV